LQEISDFWTFEAGEEIASRLLSGVIETIITMSRQPRAGVAADLFGADVREFPAGRYMVYYRPYSKGIEILHVFHGARNQKRAWKGSPTKLKRR
jgi:toxin ParE1/3/4